MIQITCKGNSASCTRTERLTSGMVGLQCEFIFDEAWDGLAKTAVFMAGNEKRDVLLTGTICTVPWEVLKTAGYQLVIGVYGNNAGGTLVIPTVYAMCGGIASGADPSGDESTDPTLPVWGQMQGMIGNLAELATTSKDNLVAAVNEVKQTADAKANAADLAPVATSGSYSDLFDKPTIPSVPTATIDANTAARHTHDNKTLLDSITEAVKTAWNTASEWVSTNGANVLSHLSDGARHIAATERSAWNGKQDKLIAGENITIADDGKTISATGGGGGASVELDTTLTQSGKAADAKAVGDALDNVATAYVLTLSTNEADAQANSDAVTAAIAEHGHVMLKPGKYPFGSMVTIPDDTTLDLGQATIFQTTYKSTTPLFCLNGVNATLKNGFLRGTYDKNDGDDGYEYFEGEVLVRVDACENGLIENVDAGFAWGVSLAFGTLAQERGYVGSAANTSGSEHTSNALPIVEGYSYVMAYGQVGYNYIFSIAPVEYVFYDAGGVTLKTVSEIPRIPVGIPSGAATFTIKTICPEFLAYYYGFTNVMPMLTVRDCYFHNNHSGGFCNSTHIITVENTKFAFMGTVDNTGTKSTRSTIYGIDIEDYPTPFMRLSNCSFFKCPKSVMDGSTISQVDNCYGYDCDFGVYRGWYHIYNNLTARDFYVQGHTNEWQYPRVYLNGCRTNTAPVLNDNSGEYLFMNASESSLYGADSNYTGGEFAPSTTYVKHSYSPSTFSFRSVLRNVALIDYSLASAGDRRASLFPKKGSEHCVWKTPYLYEKTRADFTVAPYDLYGLTTDLPIYPGGFTFYDCVFKCRFTGFVQNNGMPDTAFVGTYENCIIDCDGGGGSLFSYSNLSGARNVNLTFKNCVINNSSVPLLFGANTYRQSFAEGSKITFNNCTVLNTEANGIIGNADLTNLTVAYTSGGEGGVVVDTSLSVEGAAADAKAVGTALAKKMPLPASASVGQYFMVSAVDENGAVTAVQAVDKPSGGGGSGWREVIDYTVDAEMSALTITTDKNGLPFNLREAVLFIEAVGNAETETFYSVVSTDQAVNVSWGSGTQLFTVPGLASKMERQNYIARFIALGSATLPVTAMKTSTSNYVDNFMPDRVSNGESCGFNGKNAGNYTKIDQLKFVSYARILNAGARVRLWGVDA